MGKTALALSMARNAAVMDNVGIGMFSLEMANHQLAMRLLCAEGRVDSHLVRTGKLPKSQWKNLSLAVGQLAEAPIYLDDSAGMSVLEVRAKARRLKAEKDFYLHIGFGFVSYVQNFLQRFLLSKSVIKIFIFNSKNFTVKSLK